MFLLFGCTVLAQTPNEVAKDYPIALKGGYKIIYKEKKDLEYIYLEKRGKIITELSSCNRGLSSNVLGYDMADFAAYFVLAHSEGSGNGIDISLIRKEDGKDILKEGAYWISAVENKNILLYCYNPLPTTSYKMILYDLSSGKRKSFDFPADALHDPSFFDDVKIKNLTDRSFILRYRAKGRSETKKYYR